MRFPLLAFFSALLPFARSIPTTLTVQKAPFHLHIRNETLSDTAVARGGGVLKPESAAEANQRDDTATRAFSSVNIKTSDGQCLFIDPTAGDFRQNLIPVLVQACTGSEGEKWDIITKGKHIEQEGAMLVVSTVTQGCLNFDPRRAGGDTVVLFSCGGRAGGEGGATDSQAFAFEDGQSQLALQPSNAADTCLVPDGGKLDSATCNGNAEQQFQIG